MKKAKVKDNNYYIKHYRGQWIFSKIATYLLLILPTFILVCIKWSYYFPTGTQKERLNLTLSAGILILCLCLAIIKAVKHIESKEISFIFDSLYFFGGAGITYLLANVFNDMTLILFTLGIGFLLCGVANVITINRKKWLEYYISGSVNATTMGNVLKPKKHKNEKVDVEAVE